MSKNWELCVSMELSSMDNRQPWQLKKSNQNPGGRFKATNYKALPIQSICLEYWPKPKWAELAVLFSW